MGDVIELGCITRLDLPPDKVLEKAIGQLDSVVIMGYDKEGEQVFASSIADGGQVLWLLEQCKLELLKVPLVEDSD